VRLKLRLSFINCYIKRPVITYQSSSFPASCLLTTIYLFAEIYRRRLPRAFVSLEEWFVLKAQ
jgi:hypothetical protein